MGSLASRHLLVVVVEAGAAISLLLDWHPLIVLAILLGAAAASLTDWRAPVRKPNPDQHRHVHPADARPHKARRRPVENYTDCTWRAEEFAEKCSSRALRLEVASGRTLSCRTNSEVPTGNLASPEAGDPGGISADAYPTRIGEDVANVGCSGSDYAVKKRAAVLKALVSSSAA
jgi:hypothetical protein